MRELAEFRTYLVSEGNRYRDDRLLTYLSYEDHWPLILKSDQEIAGFALVRKSKPFTHVIGEFFIKPEFRRTGLGTAIVSEILRKFSGNWEVPFQEENAKAAVFWRKTISKLGFDASEVKSPVPDNPDLPQEIWLCFSTT